MENKSQVTLFLILGILVLVLFGSFYVLEGKSTKKVTTSALTQPLVVQDDLTSFQQNLDGTLLTSLVASIQSWKDQDALYDGGILVTSDDLKDELGATIQTAFFASVDTDQFSKWGYDYTTRSTSPTIILNSKGTSASFDNPYTITSDGADHTFEKVQAHHSINLATLLTELNTLLTHIDTQPGSVGLSSYSPDPIILQICGTSSGSNHRVTMSYDAEFEGNHPFEFSFLVAGKTVTGCTT